MLRFVQFVLVQQSTKCRTELGTHIVMLDTTAYTVHIAYSTRSSLLHGIIRYACNVIMLVPSLVLPDAFCPGYENPLENTNTPALIEDEVLRGFAPLVRTQELLDYSAVAQSAPHEQVEMCMCMCVCAYTHIW